MIEKNFDEMLDDVESSNDDFIKNYFSDDSMFVSDMGLIEQEESHDDLETEEELNEEPVDESLTEKSADELEEDLILELPQVVNDKEEIVEPEEKQLIEEDKTKGINLLLTDIDKISTEKEEANTLEEISLEQTEEEPIEKQVKSKKHFDNLFEGTVSADFINEQIKKSNCGALELKTEDNDYDNLSIELEDNSLVDDFEDTINEKKYDVDIDKTLNSDILNLLDETSNGNDFFDKLEETDD